MPRCPGCRRCRAAVPRDCALRLLPNACVQRDLFLLRAGWVVYLVVPFPGKGGVSPPRTGICSCLLPPHPGWVLGVRHGADPPPPQCCSPSTPHRAGTPSKPTPGLEAIWSGWVPVPPWGISCLSFPSRRCDAVGGATRDAGSDPLGGCCTPEPPFHPHGFPLRAVGRWVGRSPGATAGGWAELGAQVFGVFSCCAAQQQIRGWKAESSPGSSPRLLAGAGSPALPGLAFPLPAEREKKIR